MDISGRQMPEQARFVKRISEAARRVATAGLFAALVPGCATSIQLGQTPRTDRLAELKPGASNTQEIRRVLGEPAGRGAGRLPNFPLQDIWMYESAKTDGKDTHMHMLLVFVGRDSGIYEGHIWFSSNSVLERAQR